MTVACIRAGEGPGMAETLARAPVPPMITRAMAAATDAAAAEAFARSLTRTHYENFSVVSLLLPRALRQDFCNIYTFCRLADDMADEVGDRDASLRLLEGLREATRAIYAGRPRAMFAVALGATIQRHDIPIEPFLDLIDAFEQDQRVRRYQTFDELLDYCRRSADPVGRLVLYTCGYRDAERQRLSDLTCSALQLANFYQDVRRDLLDRDRIYIPMESMARFGVTESQLREGRCEDNFRRMMRDEVERAEAMLVAGRALLPMLRPAIRRHVSLFGAGGRAILRAIRAQDFDTLSRRPTLSRGQKAGLVFRALAGLIPGVGV
jgi:squalene synthase HpnC